MEGITQIYPPTRLCITGHMFYMHVWSFKKKVYTLIKSLGSSHSRHISAFSYFGHATVITELPMLVGNKRWPK